MDLTEIKHFIESALLAAGRPLNIDQIRGLFDDNSAPEKSEIRAAIANLKQEYADRGVEISDVASGFRMQIKASMADRSRSLGTPGGSQARYNDGCLPGHRLAARTHDEDGACRLAAPRRRGDAASFARKRAGSASDPARRSLY